MFSDVKVFSFEKQKVTICYHWVNDEDDETHIYKLVLVFWGKES